MKNFINGENFKKLANVIIDQNTFNKKRIYSDNDIIFCKTDYLEILFSETKYHTNKYFLITHQSDYDINEYIFSFKPASIKKWFAQNVNYDHPDLIPIPIGLENHDGPSKGMFTDFNFWTTNYNFNESYKKTNLLYCNFNPDNHPDRKNWILKLTENGFNVHTNKTTYLEHLNNLKNSLFCVSPRGNGIDCHRTWEALYFDCIPILSEHLIYDKLDYKFIQIKDPKEITVDFLLKSIKKNTIDKTDKNKLLILHWHNIIYEFIDSDCFIK